METAKEARDCLKALTNMLKEIEIGREEPLARKERKQLAKTARAAARFLIALDIVEGM